jgi:hypothetical protein
MPVLVDNRQLHTEHIPTTVNPTEPAFVGCLQPHIQCTVESPFKVCLKDKTFVP